MSGGYLVNGFVWGTYQVQHGLVYKPRLGYLWDDIVQEDFDDDFADDDTFRLWFIVLRRQANFQYKVDYLTIVLCVKRPL